MTDDSKNDETIIVVKLPENHQEVEDKALITMQKARIHLLRENPFYATLALHLKLAPDWALPYATLATDGVYLFYDPSYVTSVPFPVVKSGICHELGHVIYEHSTRVGTRSKDTWNIAGDAVINLGLKKNGMPLGTGWFCEDKYNGWYTEQVYEDLKKNPSKTKPFDSLRSLKFKDEKERKHFEETWRRRIVASAQNAKLRGKLPAGMEDVIDDLVEPRVDWRSILRNFITSNVKTDYRWIPPNRRYLSQGAILPGMRTENESVLAFCIDTSGSMSKEVLRVIVSELQGIMQQLPGMRVLVVQCDAAVHSVELLDDAGLLERFVIRGRGGTSFVPAFEAVGKAVEDGVPVQAIIYATDLMGEFGPEPSLPVLWARTTRLPVPFGEVVEVEA